MTRTAILLFALAIISPPATLGGLKKPWTPPNLRTVSVIDGCWPEYTAWYNKHHCYSDIDTGQTKCRD